MASRLPIFEVLPELNQALARASQVILQAEPGAGKSTQVPLACLKADWLQGQKIVLLEPRRLAVKNLAHFLAKQLGESVGQTIGYRIRNESKVSPQTRLEIVTEGVLTRRLQNDPELSDIGLVIFDEFHERSIHADLSLTLLLEVQTALRDDLKCLIMSATLDEAQLRSFLPEAKALFCPGRTYPVTTVYQPNQTLLSVIRQALTDTEGDILIFLAGQKAIHRAIQECASVVSKSIILLPLYGSLPPKEQEKIFKPAKQRKIIFSTNIAETSVTIEGIGCVIDSGEMKALLYDPNSGMTRLQTKRISQAAATQRAGRAGRLGPGICYRLWSEAQQNQLVPYEPEEITQVDLAPLRMELALWGAKVDELHWLTPPPKAHLGAAESLVQRLDFLTTEGKLTSEGEAAMQLGTEPRWAHLLLQARRLGLLALGCDLAALLGERDILRQTQEVDLVLRLEALAAFVQDSVHAKKRYPFNLGALQAVMQQRKRWRQRFGVKDESVDLSQAGRLLAFAYPDRIALQRGQNRYQMTNGKTAVLNAESALALQAHSMLVIASLDGQKQNGRIYLATAYDRAWLAEDFVLQEVVECQYVAERKDIVFEKVQRLDKLILQRRPSDKKPAEVWQKACLAHIRKVGLSALPLSKSHWAWLERVNWLAQFDDGFPKLTQATLLAELESWLKPYLAGIDSLKALQTLDLTHALQSLLSYDQQTILAEQAPTHYQAPTDKSYPIDYTGRVAKVSVRLQEVFGEIQSPRLAYQQVALTFELLSPAHRPIQLTADLAHFWQASYHEVAKEMRGRYPKHRWPDDPLGAQAGHSLKSRHPR